MDKDTFLSKIQEIGTCEDEVQRRTMLAELSTEATTLYETNETLTSTNDNLNKDMESLRKANMDLFKMVGSTKTESEQVKDQTGMEPAKEDKILRFEDLFDEKGEIK